jgi:S-adenosylmethionine hydrolase
MAIVLFTDFGADLYVGQVKSVLLERAPRVPVIDLLHDAPAFDARAAAHLLAACLTRFPPGSVFVAVVDPGVGTERPAVVAECAGRFLVGPDNGLLSVCCERAGAARFWSIIWRPEELSRSFHGRDLFAPVAAAIAAGAWPEDRLAPRPSLQVSFGARDLPAIVYIDRYGNACTGLRAQSVPTERVVVAGGTCLAYAPVFAAAPAGEAFWYENSLGLVEIAACRADASVLLGLRVGDRVSVQ